MKHVFFKLFCLLNLIAHTTLYAVSKSSLEFKKEQTYLIQINDDDIQSQLLEQLQSQLKGETKQNNDIVAEEKDEVKQNDDIALQKEAGGIKQDPSNDLQDFSIDQNSFSNENLNNNLEENEVTQDTEILTREIKDNNENLVRELDEEIENKNSYNDQNVNQDTILNLSDNLASIKNEIDSKDKILEIQKETMILDNKAPTTDLLNKNTFNSIDIPGISTINPNTKVGELEKKELEKKELEKKELEKKELEKKELEKKELEKKELEKKELEKKELEKKELVGTNNQKKDTQKNDLLSLLNKKQEESAKENSQKEIKLEQKNDEPGNKSFSEKIKNLFTSDKEKKVESIEIPVVQSKQKETPKNIDVKRESKKENEGNKNISSYKTNTAKKAPHKKISEEDIDITDLENVRMDNEYEYKVYEYNKKPSNFNDYKVVAKVPKFLEKAHDTFGNSHISRIYSHNDYIDTLFNAIDDEAIGAIDRIFQILKTNDVTRKDGETPLIYAAKNHKIRSLEYLLMRGADKNATNKKGETAYIVAVQNNNYEVIGILKQN